MRLIKKLQQLQHQFLNSKKKKKKSKKKTNLQVKGSIHLIQQKLLPKILKPQIQNLKNHLLKTKWKNLRKNQQLRKNQ